MREISKEKKENLMSIKEIIGIMLHSVYGIIAYISMSMSNTFTIF